MRWKPLLVAVTAALSLVGCDKATEPPPVDTPTNYSRDNRDYQERDKSYSDRIPEPSLELACHERFIVAGRTTYVLDDAYDECGSDESIRIYEAKTKKKATLVIVGKQLEYGTPAYWAVVKYLGAKDPLVENLLKRDKAHRKEITDYLASMKRPLQVPERLFTEEEEPAPEEDPGDSPSEEERDEDPTVKRPKTRVCVSRDLKTYRCTFWTTV